ncbi:hypothetical protein [Curvibacter delicatus]|uniref:hypothetical protein n=1 Tax=Curvibacter delicatus TaxID=80879 RepID=UPI000834AE8C|nr:hypothetical protein [Curvibacter delicatus]
MKHPNNDQHGQPRDADEQEIVRDLTRIFRASQACEDGQNSTCARRQAEHKAIHRLGHQPAAAATTSVPRNESRTPLAALLEWVVCDEAIDGLIRKPLVRQLRRAGEEAMVMADPGQRDVLYLGTVLWGLHMGLVMHQGKRHCCAAEQLRDIAGPALQVLAQDAPEHARLLTSLMGWSDQQDLADDELRRLMLEGLYMANLLPQSM